MKFNKFQIIILAIFVIFIIAGVAGFALYRGSSNSTILPNVTIWGTFPSRVFEQYLGTLNSGLVQNLKVTYVEKSQAAFAQDFINALARGLGPDAILVPADMVLPEVNKITIIPYTALTQRDFLNMYVGEANVYLTADGIIAVPFTIDPLMMYWNRDTFNAAGLSTYPKYWDEFTDLNRRLTTKDSNGNIRKTAIAMGDFANMTNAREVLGSLMMQVGNPIIIQSGDTAISTLKTSISASPVPAVQFFSQFANPSSPNYSWNRGLPNDKTAFLSGLLATYFGFASELSDIHAKNPNLNFDVAPLPQAKSGGVKAAYGRMYGFSIVRASANPNAAFQVISTLVSPDYLKLLAKTMYLPTVRIDAPISDPADPYISVFNQAALISRTWLDVGQAASNKIFGTLIQSVVSGQKTADEAVNDAGDQYDVALKQAMQ